LYPFPWDSVSVIIWKNPFESENSRKILFLSIKFRRLKGVLNFGEHKL
jgi:hypothetical protein